MYRLNDSARVRMMPRSPPCPYMIEMVSMNTLSTREPDHSESRKAIEMMSSRPRLRTSSMLVVTVSMMGSDAKICSA